jgi:hypothetical protein
MGTQSVARSPPAFEAGIASDALSLAVQKTPPKCAEGGIENISIFRAARMARFGVPES